MNRLILILSFLIILGCEGNQNISPIPDVPVNVEVNLNDIDNIALKKEEIKGTEVLISERTEDLNLKKKELDELLAESQDEEAKLLKSRNTASKKIEQKLFKYYEKLRDNLSNGLAVVTVRRGAAEGCNIVIPPQKIAEIRSKKKIVIDEHSGRILADVDMESMKVEKKPRRTTRKKKA